MRYLLVIKYKNKLYKLYNFPLFTTMKEHLPQLLIFLLLMGSVYSQCPVLCDSCPTGTSTCSSCFSSFQSSSSSTWIGSGTCPCPDGYFLEPTNKLCIFCPVTCETCTDANTCTSCIPGYEINQLKQCAKRYSNPGQWLTMDVAFDLTQQKLSKYNYEGFYLNDYVPSLNISMMIRSCQALSSQLFLGMYTFDYNTQIVKSYFGLAHHDWVQIKFQFVAINRWSATNMILQINDRESYRLDDTEGIYYSESKEYSSTQRHRNFCFGTSGNSEPDNLGFISVYLPHTKSMLKLKIRTDLSNMTTVPAGTAYQSQVYFGLSNLFVRTGTCPTKCRRCSGPNTCLECISPYVTTGTGTCDCDLRIAQLTEAGRCVKKCSPGYIFTKLGTIPESRCILCSLLEDKLRNCFSCVSVNNANECTVCLEGYVLNSTGYCVESCPVSTYTQVTYDAGLNINKVQCIPCGVNCSTCAFGICTSCINGSVYQEGSCVLRCSDGFYLETVRNICLKCSVNCLKCTSRSACTQCVSGMNLTLSTGSCTPQCNSSSATCQTRLCHSSCSQCFGTTENTCLSCSTASNLLQNYKCVASCSAGYFAFDGTQCLPCNNPCASCNNFEACTSCQAGFVLFQQSCIRECPVSFYPDASRICKKCSANCKTCFNDTVCLTCTNNYIMFEGKCVIATPCSQRDGFYFDEKTLQCLPCPENCASCYKDLCFRCRASSTLDNGKCVSQCSEEKTEYQENVFDAGTQANVTSRVCKWKDILCNNYSMASGNSVCNQCIFTNPMLVLLSTNKCSFTCPLGQVKVESNNVVTCQACPVNCMECLSNLTCIKCDTSYVLNPVRLTSGDVECLSTCPQGYTSDGYLCHPCKTNCKICDITGRCLQCKNITATTSYTLTSANGCVNNACNANQYLTTSATPTCLNCPMGCLTCNSLTSCSACGVIAGVQYYLQQTTCRDKCVDGFWADNLGYQCKKCPAECLKCASVTECTICTPGYYLLLHPIQRLLPTQIGTCVRQCPVGYYNSNPLLLTDKQIAYCAFCSPNCLSCFGSTQDQCLSCYGSFKLVNSRCVQLCPFNKYQDSTGHCDWCHPSCMQCTGPAQYQCKTCSQGLYLYRSTCFPYSCPGSTYPVDYDSRVCELCQWGCQVCTNPYNCSVCTGGFYLYDGWCYLQCPVNTQPYYDMVHQKYRCGTCATKWINCLECSSSTCQRCAAGYYLVANSSTVCTATCPTGYYPELSPTAQCKRCPTNCISCLSSDVCTLCTYSYILSNGQCTTKCSNSRYYSRSSSSCTTCSSYCQDCNSTTQCQNCMEGYYLYSEYQSGQLVSYCVSDCGDYRDQDEDSRTCQNCTMNCKYCNSFSNCTRCNSGYTLVNGYCYQNNNTNPMCNVSRCAKCLNAQVCQTCEIPLFLWISVSSSGPVSFCAEQCPAGMWTAGRTCHKCNTTCTKCKNGANDCDECISGWFLYQRRCYKDCPRGNYQNSVNGNCTRCPQNCFDCVNATSCKTCTSGKRSYKGQCYENCQQSTYEQGNTCYDCSSTCKKCRSLDYCTECKSSYILFEGQCRLQCPSTHFMAIDQNGPRCVKCRYPCATCKSQSECTTCNDEYAFDGEANKCVNDCGDRRYAKNASINGYLCTPCQQKCETCLNSTHCLKCTDPYTLLKGNCVQACPIGTFRDNSTATCRSCSPNCLACRAYDACIQCHNQTVLNNGKCIQLCPSGTYKTSSYLYDLRTTTYLCKPCQTPCKDCNGGSIFNCQSCVPAQYLFQSVCLDSCPVGYYPTTMELFAQTSVTVNLVKNGDFARTKCVNDWCSYSQSTYNNEVDSWIPTDQLQIGYGRIYSSYLGAQRVLELAPNKNTCVRQLIHNLIAGDYLLQFTWAARIGRDFTDCQFQVYFNGQQVKAILPTDYLPHTQTLNLSLSNPSASTLLKFCGGGGTDNSYGAVLKDVTLVKKTTEMTSFDTTLVNTVQMKCVKCPWGCTACNSRDVCTACVSGWTLNVIGQCRPNVNCAQANCEICELVTSLSICRKCINPYYLIRNTLIPTGFITISPNTNFTCVLNCPMYTYKAADFTCQPCPTNCTTCISNDCSACKPGFFLFKTSCVQTCPIGYTSNSITLTCSPTPCLYKNSLGLCEKCISPYLLYKGQCVTSCPVQTYQQDSYCLDCDQKENHCSSCTSLTTCTSCISGYFLYLGVCISKCPISYYQTVVNSTAITCLPCENLLTGCLTCQNSSICTQCKFPYFKNSIGQCLLNCPSGTFRSPYSQQCLACSLTLGLNCLSCTNETTCKSCNNRTVLFNGKCISQCPNGFYLSSTVTCQSCPSRCFTCTSGTNCTLCKEGSFLLSTNTSNLISLSCVSSCPLGYYETLNSTCAVCKSQCLTCNSDQCLSCPSSKFLFSGRCLTTCPDRYFPLNGICLVCNSQCRTCINSASSCLTCYPGFIYQSTAKTCLKNCTSINQYYDSLTYTCQNCSTDCETCYGPRYDQCLTCKDPLSLKDGLCSLQCPAGYFRDSNSVCKMCDLTKCLTCGGADNNCTSCLYPKVLVIWNSGQSGKCDINCAQGFYYDRVELSCKACSTGCILCTDAVTCTACDTTKLLYLGQCITTCPTGFISVNTTTENTCRQCPTNCAQCTFDAASATVQCTQCISPLYLFNNTCYTSCPTSTFLLNTACQPCPQRCLTCTSATNCLSCKFPYVFNPLANECLNACPNGYENINSVCKEIRTCAQMIYKGICYAQCPIGTFAVAGSNQCLDCPTTCAQCFSADLCTACKIGFYMYATEQQTITCVAICPSKTYLNNKYCTNCPPPCETCIANADNTVSCLTCLTGFSLDGKCLSTCPSGYYPLNGGCKKCISKCLTCDASACITCVNSLYTAPTCESSTVVCTSGQYVSQLTSNCENCDPSCSSCFGPSAGECKACKNITSTVYYLFGSSCLTDCPEGYVKDATQNRCTTCSIANCKNCSTSATSCITCATGYILFTNSSVTRCILSCADLNTATKIYIPSPSNPSICISCDSQLANCFNCFYSSTTSQTVCMTCATGFYLLQNGTCTSTCSNGLYVSQGKFCLPCGAYCSVCTSDTVCQTCTGGYSLYLGKCVSTCPTGFYSNTGVCTQCSANCRSCVSPTECTQCNTPFALDSSKLCTRCISGYFFSATTSSCQICSTNCLQCLTTQTTCTKCAEPLFLLNTKCLNPCPNGFYGDTVLDVCMTCDGLVPNCGSCVPGGCLKCKDTFYLQPVVGTTTYSCVSNCLAGYYPNTANMICLKCGLANCLECSTISTCTKCNAGFYALDGSCFSTCPQGYAPATINSALQCVPCKTGCKTCPASVNTCTLCNTNLQINGNGDCVPIPNNCLSTQYLNTLGTCSPCHETCLTCFGGLRINCLTCRTPEYQLQTDNSCMQMCQASQYYDNMLSACKPCTDKFGQYCTFCDSTQCSSCSQGVLSSDSQSCITSCTGATYQYNGACTNCPQFCKTCNSSTYCSECLTTSYILYNNLCYDSCPIMTQPFSGTCRPCDDKCLVCVGTTTNCNSCKSTYKLLNGNTCVDVCPNGTVETTQAGVNNKVCQLCMSPCATCSGTVTNCTSCISGMHSYLYNNMCVASCPAGTFINLSDNTCYPCQFPCTTCVSTATKCTNCASSYIYITASNSCNSPCTDGNYLYTNPSTLITSCAPCAVANCKTCDATQCYKCLPNFFGTLSNSNATISCTTTCPDYYFPDALTQTCVKCKDLCMTCTSTTNCQKCVTPYFLYQNECLTSCPDQTYQILNAGGFKCQNCGQLCATCIDNITCTICTDDAYLLNGICYSQCPTRYYARTSDKTCQPCSLQNCGTCTITSCQRCADGFYAFTDLSGQITSCVSECGNNYFENQFTATCDPCLSGCKVCQDSNNCQQCNTPKSLFVNGSTYSCLDRCPEYYFSDSSVSPLQCKRCQANCLQCFTQDDCFQCEQNFTLFYNSSTEDTCINECPVAYYQTQTPEGYAYCEACSSNCLKCIDSHQCLTCKDTHTLVNAHCVPHNCVNCDQCDETVTPAICKNCTQPYFLYKIKCVDTCPVYFFGTKNFSSLVNECQKCLQNCVNCTTNDTCDACISDYIFLKGQGCVNEAVYNYGPAANMSGFTSNITETMAAIYMGTSVGPVAFGEMSSTYFNLEFTQFMLFHPSGGNPEMTQFLNSLQTMSLTSGGTTVTNNSTPAQVQARRRLLSTTKSTYFSQSFIEVNASIFFLMFAFIGAYAAIWVFQKFVTEACRVSCNNVWFYLDAICEFMQRRFKWIYFDFIMWLSYIPFLYFAVMQLKEFNFDNSSQGFSSILAIVIIATYPLYPVFICYLMKAQYSEISVEPGEEDEEIKQTLTEMSLSPFLTKVKRPLKNIVIPFEEQDFSFGKYFNKANFILIYYPLKYIRKFAFVLVAALVTDPVTMVSALIAINLAFIAYMIALRPRVMPYIVFDLVIEFVLVAFEVFLLVYLFQDGAKIAMMSIVTHAVGFVTANLSIITAIILNIIAYYKIFLCIKDLISHLRERAAERNQAYNKFEVEKKFLDPNSDLYIEKEIGKLRKLNDDDDTDEDDSDLRLSGNARRLLENLGQKDLLLNGIDPIKYIKDITKKENYGIEEKQVALKYVNEDDVTDSDDDQLDENAFQLAKKLQMNEKNLALNKIHPVKFAKELTKNDAPLEKQYKKFDQKHIDSNLAKKINDDGLTDSDDDSIDENVMNIARNLNLNEKQLALNEINPVKFLKQDTKKDAPLEDRYKKFDQKNVDKRIARVINEDNATDSDDSDIDQQMHDLAKKLQLNEKQLAFNEINPVKFFKDETKKDAPLEQQYQKFDEKHMDKRLAQKINEEHKTDSQDDDSSVDEDAHKLARKLNLNEKQLAFNEINPMKFFKQQTKKDAPLQEQYEKFDEKNVDRNLQRIINDDGDTDSEDQQDNEGYRIARDLNLNEKQLAANNLNPVKVMQAEAKQQQKLKNIVQQFDQKDIDMKVARVINDNGDTSSQQSDDDDEEELEKIVVARQLKLDEKELAANNINPVKYAKEVTQIDPVTNQPKIDFAIVSMALATVLGPKKEPKQKTLLEKELRQRNQMKREVDENEGTDEDEDDIRLSKFSKERLKNMSQKEMVMQGLDPIKAVKKITKEAISKKMAKQINSNNRVYDDEIPDFKVSNKPTFNPIKEAIRSTQQKLKQSTKNMLGSKKQKGKQLPSEENLNQKVGTMKLIDSQSDQENQQLTKKPAKMIKSTNVKVGENRTKIAGRRQVENEWDDEFEVIDKKKVQTYSKPQNIIIQQPKRQTKLSPINPNKNIKNFDQQFSEQYIQSEQSSQVALNTIKHTYEEDLENINLEHHKSNKLIINDEEERKIINLDQDGSRKQTMRKQGESKQSRSQLNIKPEKHVRQDQMFNEFEEFEDLGQVQTKEVKEKKYARNNQSKQTQKFKKPIKRVSEPDVFEDEEISSVEQKQVKEAKFKRNINTNLHKNGNFSKQVTESMTFNDNQHPSSRNQIKSDRTIEAERYSELVRNNKANMRMPQQSSNQVFENVEYQARPSKKNLTNKSKLNSDNESDSGEYSQAIRKERMSGKQRVRSKNGNEQESNKIDSRGASQVMRKEGKLRVEKVKIEDTSENEDEIQRVDI